MVGVAEAEYHGALAVVVFLAAAEGFVFQGFVTFLPAFLAEVGGASRAAAAKGGALSAAVLLLGVPGQLVGGRLAETEGRTLALRYAGLYAAAVPVGLAVRAAGASIRGVALAGLFSLLAVLRDRGAGRRRRRRGRRPAGLAAVFGFLGLVAVVNTLGGLTVRLLLGRGAASTTTPPQA